MLQEVTNISSATLFRIQPHRAKLLRLAVALGMLIAGPIVGVLVVRMDWQYVLIATLIPVFLVVLPRLELSPLIILITAAFVRFSLSTGTQSPLVASLLLTMCFVGIWVFRMLLVERRLRLNPSPANRPLFGFMLVTLVSLVWSNAFRDPLVIIWRTFPFVQLASAIVMIMLPGAFLLVANHVNNLKLLKIMVALMLFCGVVGVIGRYGLGTVLVQDGGLFTMWIISLSVGLALFNRRMAWLVRGLLLILAATWIYFRFGGQISWLAGWLPGFVAIGILAFMRSKKLLLVLLIFMVISIGTRSDYYLGSVIGNESNESGSTRLEAWGMNWRVTGKHLLFGTGPGGYAAYYMSYFPDNAVASHSNLIDVVAQTGIAGLLLFLWFFISLAWTGYRLAVRLKGRGDFAEGLANAGLAGTVACTVALGFGDWLLPFAYTQGIAGFDYVVYSWLFMGTILALDRLTLTNSGACEEP